LAGAALVEEPVFKPPKGLQAAAGVVIREPDGRIWVVCPTNQYGDHEVTFPKGRLEGKSLQATALCEAYEESGLRVRLIRHLVDIRRTQTYTRYYLAERVGGSPADMGWESQCVVLVPEGDLRSLDLAPADKQLVRALEDSVKP
jgi:8-oxo-dGTP pyrophosphatase MutT (NUDIX family)